MGNSDIAHRILVNDAVDTELTSINCVKSSADKDNFNDAERKSKTNVVSLSRKIIDLWQFISNQYQH